MYDKIFDVSKMIVLTDIVIFCNIEPHSDPDQAGRTRSRQNQNYP